MSHFRSLSPDPSTVTHRQATSGEDKQELGYWAVWSLSSAKAGFGIHQLRDDDFRVRVSSLLLTVPDLLAIRRRTTPLYQHTIQ
jgi:hypothetical protein